MITFSCNFQTHAQKLLYLATCHPKGLFVNVAFVLEFRDSLQFAKSYEVFST
jgi:hypothetical protein